MKLLYIECRMGAAGDMLMAALSELLPDPDGFIAEMNSLGLEGVEVSRSCAQTCGIGGTHISVKIGGKEEESHDVHHHEHHHHHDYEHEHHHEHHHHEHHHSSLGDIEHIISHLPVSERVKTDTAAVYRLIAEAESSAHSKPVEEIHFHEVGTLDAVADIVGVCLLMEKLAPDKVVVSPVNTGYGQVRCAHGILPVPAPATAYILRGIPSYSGSIEGELCTPTGAALLKHFGSEFGSMPVMTTEAVGYGIGKKEFPAANCVRAFIGEIGEAPEQVCELRCNIDDMTGEQIAFAEEMLFAAGALDVFTTPIGMKKNRPAVMLTVLCREEQREELLKTVFRHTTTIGIRENICTRYTLARSESVRSTAYGDVRVKEVSGYGVHRSKAEFDDLAELARINGISIDEIK